MFRRPQPTSPRAPAGYTLLELLLVLVVLVFLGSMAWPSLVNLLDSRHLRRGADQVRTAWNSARVKAVTSGVIYAFRYQEGTGQYEVLPWASLEPPPDVSAVAAIGTAQIEGVDELPDDAEQLELPSGIQFLELEQEFDSRDLLWQPNDLLSGMPGQWSSPIFFHPDGRTSTVDLSLENKSGETLVVSLRGLTGVSTVGEILEDVGDSP